MYGFHASFGMHSTCIWFLGHDLSLACRISWIDNGIYPFLLHFLNSHGVVGSPFGVFLLVLRFHMVVGWDRIFGALEYLGYLEVVG